MATLSANSRKNSAVSAVAVVSAKSNGTEAQRSHVQSLEDAHVVDILPPSPIVLHHSIKADMTDEIDHMCQVEQYSADEIEFDMVPSNNKKEKTRVEHSDSGFSDRSTSSNGPRPYTNSGQNSAIISIGKTTDFKRIAEAEDSDPEQRDPSNLTQFGAKLSVNMLKQKLEKMVEASQEARLTPSVNTKKLIRKLSSPYMNDSKESVDTEANDINVYFHHTRSPSPAKSDSKITSTKKQLNSLGRSRNVLIRSASMHHKRIVEKEPIMRSDFTNTVKMRKKSLECNAHREKLVHSPRIILESSGIVSKLLQRFDSRNNSITSTSSDPTDLTTEGGFLKEVKQLHGDGDANEITLKQNDDVFETLSTPLVRTSVTIEPLDSSSKPIDGSCADRIITTRRELINIGSSVYSINAKAHSPTKKTNNSISVINRLPRLSKTANSHKKSRKSTTAEAIEQPIAESIQRGEKNTPGLRITAYASFNRISPIRLSGRVKEVTVRTHIFITIMESSSLHQMSYHTNSIGK